MSDRATCHDDFDPNSLPVPRALQFITEKIEPVAGFERLFLHQALDRVLDEDVRSPRDVPPFANSAMDGYALRGADLPHAGTAEFTVVGKAFAGHPFTGTVGVGEAVHIMTGAPVPEGADTVIMQERVEALPGGRIRIQAGHRAGENVRQAGEDIAAGSVVLARGRRLQPADLGLLASLGIAEVRCRRRPRVAIFSTGDELRPLGAVLGPGEIYDSNRYTLHALLTRLGMEVLDLGAVSDDRAALAEALQSAAGEADALITSGGVSVGEADYVKGLLEELGEVHFWKLAMKPGRPLAFGQLGRCYFFGLPGNPVSVAATFYQFVAPALRRLAGEAPRRPLRLRAVTLEPLKKRPGRVDFQRGILENDETGRLTVRSTGNQGSHVLSSMSRANCFIVLNQDQGDVPAGTEVTVQYFPDLL